MLRTSDALCTLASSVVCTGSAVQRKAGKGKETLVKGQAYAKTLDAVCSLAGRVVSAASAVGEAGWASNATSGQQGARQQPCRLGHGRCECACTAHHF